VLALWARALPRWPVSAGAFRAKATGAGQLVMVAGGALAGYISVVRAETRAQLTAILVGPACRRIDTYGKITLRDHCRSHHIGVGRAHARTRVLLLICDPHIRVVNAATGELLRDLTLDPSRNYQPTGKPRRPTRKTNRSTPGDGSFRR
jgi:hypothetical protein